MGRGILFFFGFIAGFLVGMLLISRGDISGKSEVSTADIDFLSRRVGDIDQKVDNMMKIGAEREPVAQQVMTGWEPLLQRVAQLENRIPQLATVEDIKKKYAAIESRTGENKHAVATVPAGNAPGPKAFDCRALASRPFEYRDHSCGSIRYKLEDLLIAFRNEQAYWNNMLAAHDPWWAVDTAIGRVGLQPDVNVKVSFYKSGIDWTRDMQGTLRKAFGEDWSAKGAALDLGCGLGRLSFGLLNLGYQKVVCVDQAQNMLERAHTEFNSLPYVKKRTPRGSKIDFVQSGPDLLCKVPPGSVNFAHSVITLQHMKPHLQVAYMEQLCDSLSVGGTGYFQIPILIYGDNGGDFHCSLEASKVNVDNMEMHYVPEKEARRHLEARGCKVVLAEEKDRVGAAGKSMHFVFLKETVHDDHS